MKGLTPAINGWYSRLEFHNRRAAMIDMLKKALFTGVGMVAMSREKVEEWAKNFAKEASFAEEEGKKFVDEVLKQSEEARKTLEQQVDRLAKSAMERFGMHTKEEVDELKKKIEDLERKLNERQ